MKPQLVALALLHLAATPAIAATGGAAPVAPAEPVEWVELDGGAFTLSLPSNWWIKQRRDPLHWIAAPPDRHLTMSVREIPSAPMKELPLTPYGAEGLFRTMLAGTLDRLRGAKRQKGYHPRFFERDYPECRLQFHRRPIRVSEKEAYWASYDFAIKGPTTFGLVAVVHGGTRLLLLRLQSARPLAEERLFQILRTLQWNEET